MSERRAASPPFCFQPGVVIRCTIGEVQIMHGIGLDLPRAVTVTLDVSRTVYCLDVRLAVDPRERPRRDKPCQISLGVLGSGGDSHNREDSCAQRSRQTLQSGTFCRPRAPC